jgi:hypothetical protein
MRRTLLFEHGSARVLFAMVDRNHGHGAGWTLMCEAYTGEVVDRS